jgi:ribosomal protein S18 acetylase RimI-like enzyme
MTGALREPETSFEVRGTPYRLALLEGEEVARLSGFFCAAFGRRLFTPEWLRRKYAYACRGARACSYVALDEHGEPVGAVGLLPAAVRFGDHVELAAQLIDCAVAASQRGRGLFVALADAVRERCQAAGISFLFGFPNEQAYPAWVRHLGYEHVHDLVEYRLSVRTLPVERAARRVRPLRPLYSRYARRALARRAASDHLENSLLAEGFAGVERDAGFQAYKASFTGGRTLALGGGRAWLKVDGGLFVGDLEAASEADLDATLRALERLAVRLGSDRVLLQASEETRFATLLPSRYRRLPGLPVIHRDLGSRIPAARLRFTSGDLDNF